MPNLVNVLKAKKIRKYTNFAVVVSLILGIILFGVFSIDLDSLRKPFIKELSEITGLTIEIESLNFSLSSGLSLRGSGLKVRSKDNSQQIFSAQNIFLNAKLKPLLKGQLKIRKIILVNPIMNAYWFSILIGWLAKVLVTRYGNKDTYRIVRGLFVGLIVGELMIILAALIGSLVTGNNVPIDLNRN